MQPIATVAICSLLWLPAVYYGYLAVVYCGYLQSTMATCRLLWLPVDYFMAICSLQWLPVVYYGYTYSFPSVLSNLLYTITLLCLYLVFIITASVLLSLQYLVSLLCYCLLCLPIYSCIPCLVYTWLSSLPCLSSPLSFLSPPSEFQQH